MRRFAVFILAMLALICAVVAEVPYLDYNIDFQRFDSQFEVQSAVQNTPLLRFWPKLGTNTYNGAGYTYLYRYGRTDSSAGMTTITGAWNSGRIEFQVRSNDFPVIQVKWYAALVAQSNNITVSFARGRQTITRSPEIDSAESSLTQVTNIYGPGYGFTGSFAGWPFPVESGSISQFTGETAASGLVWTARGPGLPGFWGPGGTGASSSVSANALTNLVTSNSTVILIYFPTTGVAGIDLIMSNLVAQLAAAGVHTGGVVSAEVDPIYTSSVAFRITAADTNFWYTNFIGKVPFTVVSNAVASLTSNSLMRSSNGSDIASASAFRSNLGLGNAATNSHTAAIWNASQIQGVDVSTNAPATGQILVRASALGPYTPRSVTGDVVIASDGSSTIQSGSITLSKVDTNSLDNTFAKDTELSAATSAIYTAIAGKMANTGGSISGRANLSGAAQGTNMLTLRNTATPGAGMDVEINSSSTDYMMRFSRGSTVEYGFYPSFADFGGNDLRNVNAITGGWFVGDGAGVTNTDAETIDGIDSTNLTDLATFRLLNNSAINNTNPQAQRVLGDFNAQAIGAASNIFAACTNCAMSTNMMANGDMALGGLFWVFGGGANSNAGNGGQMISAANTQGTAQQSNQFAATAGPWQLSYTNTSTDATGSVKVTWGGVDHWQVGPLTGYVSWIVTPRTTNGWALTANATGSTAWAGKNFTLKQVFSGEVGAAYGSFTHLHASNAVVDGNIVVAGTISGDATGYVARAGSNPVYGDIVFNAGQVAGAGNISLKLGMKSFTGLDTVTSYLYSCSVGGSNELYFTAGAHVGLSGRVWRSDNDGAASGLDAGLLGGVSYTGYARKVAINGATSVVLNSEGLVDLGTISAATTAGVDTLVFDVTNILTGDVEADDSATVNAYQNGSNGVSWLVNPGAVSGIDGRTLTNAVPLNLGTGAVALASLGNVPHTGQVNLININGTNYLGNLGFSGSGLSVSGTQLVFSGGSGGTGTMYAINGFYGPEVTIAAGANITVTTTGGIVNIAGAASGGSTSTLYAINGSYGPAVTIEGSGVTTTGAVINIAAGGSSGASWTDFAYLELTGSVANVYTNAVTCTMPWDYVRYNTGIWNTGNNEFVFSGTGVFHVATHMGLVGSPAAGWTYYLVAQLNNGSGDEFTRGNVYYGLAEQYAAAGGVMLIQGNGTFLNRSATNRWKFRLFQSSGGNKEEDDPGSGYRNYITVTR